MAKPPKKPLTATDLTAQALRQASSAYDELRRFTASDRISEAVRQAKAVTAAEVAAGAAALSPAPPSRILKTIATTADLGRLVRQAREAMNLTQTEFADMAGVGRRFVSELENGKATLELGKVMAACAAAGIDLLAAQR